ncbi:CsbD family protein [Streptomyces sp. NPDC020362]|uniref:CsbD family protein n=1 Tax=unclassified Streptomyces TaxID=2593676 RepID=UPI000A9647A4
MVMHREHAKVKQVRGKMKETLGKALGDNSMRRSGRREQVRGKAQEMTARAADQVRKRIGH